jgi:hypothetical protein
MAQQPSTSHDLPADFDHHVVLFPTRTAAYAQSEPAGQSAVRPAAGRVRSHTIRQVVVLAVSCPLSEGVEELDRAIQLALADGPRGVVCDLSNIIEGADPAAAALLATAGRHVRDWPGIPIAVACPNPQVREALRAQPLGRHLMVTASLFSAVLAVLATPTLALACRELAAHPTAPRASREFVTGTLMDWQLDRVIPFASLVVSELVASSSINAGTNITVSVAWNLASLRLTVRDHGPALPGQRPPLLYLQGRRLTVVAGLSRAFGVLPTADGGKVVWAVLDAPRSRPSHNTHLSASQRQESLILKDAGGLAGLPLTVR